jgi:hypothetical protein
MIHIVSEASSPAGDLPCAAAQARQQRTSDTVKPAAPGGQLAARTVSGPARRSPRSHSAPSRDPSQSAAAHRARRRRGGSGDRARDLILRDRQLPTALHRRRSDRRSSCAARAHGDPPAGRDHRARAQPAIGARGRLTRLMWCPVSPGTTSRLHTQLLCHSRRRSGREFGAHRLSRGFLRPAGGRPRLQRRLRSARQGRKG